MIRRLATKKGPDIKIKVMNNLSWKAKISQKKGIKRWGNGDIFTSSIRLLLFRHTANVSPAFAAKKRNTLSQKLICCSKYIVSLIYIPYNILIDTVKSHVLTGLI